MIAFLTLLKREVKRFRKVLVQTIVAPFVSSFLYLLIFGVSLGSQVEMKEGIPYIAYLIPGLMMMGLINNAYQNSSSSIVNMKFTGELEDLAVVPLSLQEIIAAMSLASFVRGGIVALVTGIVGALFMFWTQDEFINIAHPWAVIYFATMAGLSFGAIGISIAFWAKTFDQLSAFSTFVLIPLTYLGGVFISIDKLSGFWRLVASLNPLLYFVEGIRYGFIGQADVSIPLAMTISLLAWIIFSLAAFFTLRRPGVFARW